jgi:hypothetical protein
MIHLFFICRVAEYASLIVSNPATKDKLYHTIAGREFGYGAYLLLTLADGGL